jgi:TolB-like protein
MRIGSMAVDLSRGCLRDPSGREIALRPKSLELLKVLADSNGRTLSKAQLLDQIWPCVHVTEDSLFQCVMEVRRALGDDWRLLRTVAKQGYRLDIPVQPEAGPSLAVLPFRNQGNDATDAYFVEGIWSELLNGLCRIRWLRVTSRGASGRFAGPELDPVEAARQLGAQYALWGSIGRTPSRIRVHCRLHDVAVERLVWSERFEESLGDIFALQDHIAASVVGAVEPRIRLTEVERARRKPTESLDAYDLYLRALPHHLSSRRERLVEAQALLDRAIEHDPDFSLAKAFSALTCVIQANQGWTTPDERALGVRRAREALADHRDDPVVLRCAGHGLAYLAHECATGWAFIERALALHPNSAEVHHSAGWVQNFLCDGDAALPHFEEAVRLSPSDPEIGHTLMGLSFAHLLAGRPEAALTTSRQAAAAMPNSISALRAAIFALCELGRVAEAQKVGQSLMRVNPLFRVEPFAEVQPFSRPDFAERYLAALRMAGLPD